MTYPTNPADATTRASYLRNITQALYLDGSNNVTLRTGFSGNINISGNVAIPGSVDSNVYRLGNVVLSSNSLPVTVQGNVAVTQASTPWAVQGNVQATIQGTSSVAFAAEATDAFGRLRVSNPYTLFDTSQRYYDHGQYSTQTSGAGSTAFNASSSTFELNVGTGSTDSVVRETKRVFPYQPGKSLLIFSTFCMSPAQPNLRQRIGFFGASNGIYLEQDGSTANLVIRSSSSGSLVEDRIPQSQWNGDKLDGTGKSGITLNLALDQIFWIDVEWLGVGSVRTGFVINGAFITAHTFHHANTASKPGITDNTATYMTTATLPLRCELANTGVTVQASKMRQICASVISEGGYNSFGTTQLAGTGISPLTLTNAGTYYPVVSIRLVPSRLDAIVLPRQVDVMSPGVNYFRWALIENATLTGATWSGTSPTGTVQYDTSATAVSGGKELQSGYVSEKSISQLFAVDAFQYQLGRSLTGGSDTVTLVISATNNQSSICAQLGWQELS